MKRLLITEEEKQQILSLYQQSINEISEVESPLTTILNAKKYLSDMGVSVNPSDIVDENNPICVPQTDDKKSNGIIDTIWTWAHSPENKGNLKQKIQELKNAIKTAKEQKNKTNQENQMTGETSSTVQFAPNQPVNEQAGAALITIGSVSLGAPALLIIGGILILILVIALIAKSSKGGKYPCKKNYKNFKRRGIEGLF